MITEKIKALFQFIEYLHSNIENFNQYNGLIKELESLNEVRSNLKPEQNYKDKLQYNKVQAEIKSKLKTLQDNTTDLIKAKAKELNVCNFDNEPNYFFNGIETEIRQLKDNFSNEVLPLIFKHKNQYLEYRSQTQGMFLSLQFFFDELDEIAKNLFDYFKDTERNEFEAFEIKAIPVNSIEEAIQGFKKGQTKFTLPRSFLFNTTSNEEPKNETLPPQQTEKPKPKLNEALISFSSTEIIERIHIELKGYFQGKEAEFKRALQGKQLQEFLLFPHNQNKFVEVFKRLKYNGFLLSTPKEIKDWICSNFTYQYQRGNQKEVREFNTSTVHDILTKDKGEPTKKERICIVDWLPYKSHLARQREAEIENI